MLHSDFSPLIYLQISIYIMYEQPYQAMICKSVE